MRHAVTVGFAHFSAPSDETAGEVVDAVEDSTPLSVSIAYPAPGDSEADEQGAVIAHVGDQRPTKEHLKAIYAHLWEHRDDVDAVSRQEVGDDE